MQKYQNNVQNRNGDAVSGAIVSVITYPGGDVATLYSDNGITPLANPVITDGNGEFSFYVADGRYSLAISGRGIQPHTITDISIAEELPPAIVADLANQSDTAKGASLVGYNGDTVRTALNARVTSADLANTTDPAKGDALVGVKQPVTGAVARTQHDKNADILNAHDFGAIGDGTLHPLSERFASLAAAQAVYPHATALTDSIDWAAIQAGIDACNVASTTSALHIRAGTYIQNQEFTEKSNVKIYGDGRRVTVIKKAAGYNGDAMKSANFDVLTGDPEALSNPLLPTKFGIYDLTFDGNYLLNDWKSVTNSYVNTSGGGLKLVAAYYELDCEVFNMAGVGVYSECSGSEVEFNDRRDIDWRLDSFVCKEECLIFKGPPDGRMQHLYTAAGGARIYSEQSNPPPSSPTYGSVNGGLTDNVVFDGAGAEIGKMHTFGCLTGAPWRTLNGGRVNIDLLIAESGRYGGVNVGGSTTGIIDKLDVHGCNGGLDGSIPDCVLATSNSLIINSLYVDANSSVDSGQDRLVISGAFVQVGNAYIRSRGKAGHGITLSGAFAGVANFVVDSCIGVAHDGRQSAALLRLGSSSTYHRAKGIALSCDRAFFSVGTPLAEKIDIQYKLNTGQQVFEGTQRTSMGQQDWHWNGTINGVVAQTSHFFGNSLFDPTLTTVQTLTIPHTLSYAPNINNVETLNVQDSPTSIGTGNIGFLMVTGIDATNITVQVKMSTANGVNTSPRVSVKMSV